MDNSHRPSSTSLFIAISYVEGTYPPSTSFIAFIIFPKRTGGFHQVASHLSVMFPPNDRSLYASPRILRCSEKLPIAKASHATSALSLNAVDELPVFHVKLHSGAVERKCTFGLIERVSRETQEVRSGPPRPAQ